MKISKNDNMKNILNSEKIRFFQINTKSSVSIKV